MKKQLMNFLVTFPTTDSLLNFMVNRGSSLELGWGEDHGWECSWITGGERFTAVSKHLLVAVRTVLLQAYEKAPDE